MAITGNRYHIDRRSAYVYGNAVPKPSYEPEHRQERSPSEPKKRTSARVRQNRRRARSMNRAYMIFLTCASVVALIVCINYIKLQSSITSRTENITKLQEELAQMKETNTTKYNSVMDSVNLEEISKKAQEDLGMVPASSDEIVTYDSPATDYVDQKEDVPDSGVLAQSDDNTK